MIARFHIHLATVVDKQSLYDVFASTFGFPVYFGNNWDALYDMMSSFDPAAAVFRDLKNPLTGVHLIFDNFDILEEHLSDSDMSRFNRLLVELSVGRDFRADHLSFTFEIRYTR